MKNASNRYSITPKEAFQILKNFPARVFTGMDWLAVHSLHNYVQGGRIDRSEKTFSSIKELVNYLNNQKLLGELKITPKLKKGEL